MVAKRTTSRAVKRVAKGVTAVGASGGSFAPTSIANLWAWLDASDGSTVLNSVSPDVAATDGQTIRRWQDKSGNGNHANQETGIQQPVFESTSFSGKGGVYLDGVDDAFYLPENTSSAATIFVVLESSDSSFVMFWNDSGSNFFLTATDGNSSTQVDNNSGSPAYRVNGSAITEPITRDGLHAIYATGSPVVAGVTSLNFTSYTGRFQLGDFPSGSFPYDGKVGELILYNASLSASEVEQVETYLLSKWGVS